MSTISRRTAVACCLFAFAGHVLAAPSAIRLDQLGFAPGAHKLAIVAGDDAPAAFSVVRADNGRVVLRGQLSAPATWEPAGVSAAIADFSALTTPGRYRLQVRGLPPSDPFSIDPDAYAGLADAARKAYYFNRASLALDAAQAGPYARAAGHPDTQVDIHASAASPARPAGTVVSAPKGWYDAGDYNKYVVNSGISTWTLLTAFDHYPEFFRGRDLNIPESGNAVPDILDEALWNLEWMLAMQDPTDGGVYHKLSNLGFDGNVMPAQATARRYMIGKGTAATLDFAAVMAKASRAYAPYEAQFPGLSARMRKAAESAWGWALVHPDLAYVQPADVKTGGYNDEKFGDEFAWAAAELYLLTGEKTYFQTFERYAAAPDVPSWAQVGSLGWMSLAAAAERLPDDAARARVKAGLQASAAALAAKWRLSPWRLATQKEDFRWGSNADVLNQAMILLQGYRLGGGREQLDAAQSQLDYVLGRNPLGVSFVTGQGLRTPMHIHHRPSQADGVDAPVPGWLSGGPNPGQQDSKDCGGVRYPSTAPALSWLDDACSYASNEVAINWNAPLVYVAAALQSLTPAATATKD
ncbi:MAG TPA: glycoside hydrolase family 9 protein [Stenotrophomonas sp.]|nr:glycoside hydrolase family 9 protein [Stenotrophomonas sp.]